MTIANLPNDLEWEILARVPAKSLQELKTTCKRWYSLFRDPKFVEKNNKMSKAARESMLLSNYEVYSIPGDLHELYNSSVVEPDIEFTGKLWVDLYMYAIYHCDGLMLCQTEDNPRLVVWNPCTGQTSLIEPRTFYSNYDRCALGYSSTSSRRSYKILRCCSYRNDKRVKVVESEIYELSSDSWRVVESFSLEDTLFSGSVSLKGDGYWVAANETGCFLMKFDFMAERFARLPLPFQSDDVCEDNVLLSVVRDEKLAVSCTVAGSDVMRIWITNKIDDDKEAKDLSWRTDFVLQVDCAKYNVSMENFLLDEENNVAVCCGKYHKNGYVTMIYIVGEDMYKQVYELCSHLYNWPLLITYVPSLIRIPRQKKRRVALK
ncbi:hypothetical protein Bca4012_008191 [Brassica carinata]